MSETKPPLVERLKRFHDTLNVDRHYMTGQACREIQRDIREAAEALEAMREALRQAADGFKFAASRLSALGDETGAATAFNDRNDCLAALDMALSLCAAALRARATQTPSTDDLPTKGDE